MTEAQPRWLIELAERKLGAGATVDMTRDGWTAARGAVEVFGKTRDILVWFLEQMKDKSDGDNPK